MSEEAVKNELKAMWLTACAQAFGDTENLEESNCGRSIFTSIMIDTMFYRHKSCQGALSLRNVEDLYQLVELNKFYTQSTTPPEIKNQIDSYFKALCPHYQGVVSNSLVAKMDQNHDLWVVRAYICQGQIEQALPIVVEKHTLSALTVAIPQPGTIVEKAGFKL